MYCDSRRDDGVGAFHDSARRTGKRKNFCTFFYTLFGICLPSIEPLYARRFCVRTLFHVPSNTCAESMYRGSPAPRDGAWRWCHESHRVVPSARSMSLRAVRVSSRSWSSMRAGSQGVLCDRVQVTVCVRCQAFAPDKTVRDFLNRSLVDECVDQPSLIVEVESSRSGRSSWASSLSRCPPKRETSSIHG